MKIKQAKKIHFTGIKGVGMTSLALCAQDLKIKVTGSDIEEYFITDQTLKKANISWQKGFDSRHIGKPDCLIYTAAHGGEENIEVKAAKSKQIPVYSQGQALGKFMEGKKGISVSGVGGKTTTSSMIATVFATAGLAPSFAIGTGELKPLGFPGRYNLSGKHFIAEADEYFSSPQDQKAKLFYQNPQIAVITNIEYDHPDVYKNLDQTIDVFANFANKVPKNGLVVACLDNSNVQKLVQLIKAPLETYGFSPEADWRITSINKRGEEIVFSLIYKNKEIKDLAITVPGQFNVKNAVAAFIVSYSCHIPVQKIKKGLRLFQGTKRRFEFIQQIGGIKFFDDYAHHPIQIKATLKAVKNWFTDKRLVVVFQPHTYSRTKSLLADFSQSFSQADKVFVIPIYASAREKKDPEVSSQKLAALIKNYHSDVSFVTGKEELVRRFKKELRKGDLVFTLGAGDIFNWQKDFSKVLK